MYPRPEEEPGHPGFEYNIYDTLWLYLNLGAPPAKMLMGVSSHATGYTLQNETLNGIYCPATGRKIYYVALLIISFHLDPIIT